MPWLLYSLGKSLWCPLNRGAGWVKDLAWMFWRREDLLPLPGTEPAITQPTSHYFKFSFFLSTVLLYVMDLHAQVASTLF